MAWHVGEPVGNKSIKELIYFMPENWTYIQTRFAVDHTFPGSLNVNAGLHKAGQCRVFFYGPASAIAALTGSPSGAMAYDTQNKRLKYYTGSAWSAFDDLLHKYNDQMTGNLVVSSAIFDGRDPSVDGAKLDTISENATSKGASGKVGGSVPLVHNDVIPLPATPSGKTWNVNIVEAIASNSKSCSAAEWSGWYHEPFPSVNMHAIVTIDGTQFKYDGLCHTAFGKDPNTQQEVWGTDTYIPGQALVIGCD